MKTNEQDRIRLRKIVSVAALGVETPSVQHWLFMDEQGTWERRAAELIEKTNHLAKQQGLTQNQQDGQISVFIGYEAILGALEFAKNEERIHKPAREATRAREAQRLEDNHPPLPPFDVMVRLSQINKRADARIRKENRESRGLTDEERKAWLAKYSLTPGTKGNTK